MKIHIFETDDVDRARVKEFGLENAIEAWDYVLRNYGNNLRIIVGFDVDVSTLREIAEGEVKISGKVTNN
jgi:hypothetical protein